MIIRIIYNMGYLLAGLIGLIFFIIFNPRRFFKEFGVSWKERLGFYPPPCNPPAGKPTVIIRCASLGETKIGIRLFEALKENFFVVFAVGTRSGWDFAANTIGISNEGKSQVVFTPPDFFYFVKKFFLNFSAPLGLIFIESDLWPEFVWQGHDSGARLLVVNGRMSPRTASIGKKCRKFFMQILRYLDKILVRYKSDEIALRNIGVQPDKILVTGNVKYDFSSANSMSHKLSRDILPGISESDFVVVAGSTHRPDEVVLKKALMIVKKNLSEKEFLKRFRMVVVPRYIERASSETREIFSEFQPVLYSNLQNNTSFGSSCCLIVDKLGLLEGLYSICDVAFIGGSFGSRGGQEPMSAAYSGKPVIYGPGMSKFIDETSRLESVGGAIKVNSYIDLGEVLIKLYSDESFKISIGKKAFSAAHSDIGAYTRTTQVIKELLLSKL